MHWEPVTPDGALTDGELVDGLRVIHCPGHPVGHVALHHEPAGTLLTGDAVFHLRRLGLGPAAPAQDPDSRRESVVALPAEVGAVGFAHEAPLTDGAAETFGAFLPTAART
jgi:glyoxylase-like metal-dependent hydrolase (beta-lactamase superfamily II)